MERKGWIISVIWQKILMSKMKKKNDVDGFMFYLPFRVAVVLLSCRLYPE